MRGTGTPVTTSFGGCAQVNTAERTLRRLASSTVRRSKGAVAQMDPVEKAQSNDFWLNGHGFMLQKSS